ncbi:MAG: DegT/DnrJ/EryC1/StrS family aminotransferase [bacterium]
MKPVFIASEPNSEKDDRMIARRLLFRPFSWKKGKYEDAVVSKLKQLTNSKYCYTFSTGRAAIYSVLQAINVKPGDEVIVQAFTCLAVPLPIKWLGAKPIYVDIEPQTYNPPPDSIQKAITEKTRAVVVQHTFGIPAQIDKIRKIVDTENSKRNIQNKIYLIEDLAHSFGGKYKGKILGKWGDAAILSFGQEKVVSCTQGGAVITNDELVDINIKKQYEKIGYPNLFQIKRNIMHPLLWNIINKTYYFPPVISIGKMLIVLFRILGLLKSQADPGAVDFEKPEIYKLSNAQSEILVNQLDKLEEFTEHRKKITNIYESKYKKGWDDLPLLRYPVSSEKPEVLVSNLKKNKIIPGNWYNNPIYPKSSDLALFDYFEGSCPNAEILSKRIVNLPTSINVSENEAKRIERLT